MVQGGLLMARTGGVHGYGWSPGGPDLEMVTAVEQRGVRENQIHIRGFYPEG